LDPFYQVQTANGARAIFNRDRIMEKLLDPELAEKDPFQAAMGLVLLRRAGLKW
jgi:hypothetical protein